MESCDFLESNFGEKVKTGSGKCLTVNYTMHHHTLAMAGHNRTARTHSCSNWIKCQVGSFLCTSSFSTHGIFCIEDKVMANDSAITNQMPDANIKDAFTLSETSEQKKNELEALNNLL